MTGKRVPIAAAKRLAQQYGYEQVVVLAINPEKSWITTYGKNREKCDEAGKYGNAIGRWLDGELSLVRTDHAEEDAERWRKVHEVAS